MNRWQLTAWLYRLREQGLLHRIHEAELSAVKRLLADASPPAVVLDAGCGRSRFAGRTFPDSVLLLVDASAAMLRHQRSGWAVCASALALPVADESADLVLALGLSEYIEEETALLKELGRVLKEGGQMVYTVSPPGLWTALRRLLGHRLWPRKPDDVRRRAAAAGFRDAGWSDTFMQQQFLFVKE